MSKQSRISDNLLIATFSILLAIPFSGIFFQQNLDKFRNLLNRDPNPLPPFNLKKLGRTDFKGIERWFTDNALFIPQLSQIWSNLGYRLGTSVKPGQAILGKDDWLFLGNDYAASIDQYTGKNIPIEDEIYAQLTALQVMKNTAKRHKIPFVVMIAPDKHEIYPEYLPANIKKGPHKNRLELLEEAMEKNQVDFISLKQHELEAKKTLGPRYGDLYMKGDSHWNYLGAYVAYQQLANYLHKINLNTASIQYDFIPDETSNSDLTKFLQLYHIKSNAPKPDISKLTIQMIGEAINGQRKSMEPLENSSIAITLNQPYANINQAVMNKQTCLLIGDSFSDALSFFIHNDFYNTVLIHTDNKNWNLSTLIKRYHPDLIIYEKVERDLIKPIFNFQLTADPVDLKIPEKTLEAKGQIERFRVYKDKIQTKGWAYIPHQNAALNQTYLKLTKGTSTYLFTMNPTIIQKINFGFDHPTNHANLSGFTTTILRNQLENGTYKASIIIENKGIFAEKQLNQTYTIG